MMHRLLMMYAGKPEMQRKIIAAFAEADVDNYVRNWIAEREEYHGKWKGEGHDRNGCSDSSNRDARGSEYFGIN